VLDAAAWMALANGERGANEVKRALRYGTVISTVQLAELYAHQHNPQKALADNWRALLDEWDVTVIDLNEATARRSGELWPAAHGLAGGVPDRICIALAAELRLQPIITEDEAPKWAAAAEAAGVEVKYIPSDRSRSR
jgi:PIN domain nuclease of toxin-antitoxin system